MTSGGRYEKRSPAWRGKAEAMELIGSEPVAEKREAQLFQGCPGPFSLKGQRLP